MRFHDLRRAWPFFWHVGTCVPEVGIRAGTSNYIFQIQWDIITCPCPQHLLLAARPHTCTSIEYGMPDKVMTWPFVSGIHRSPLDSLQKLSQVTRRTLRKSNFSLFSSKLWDRSIYGLGNLHLGKVNISQHEFSGYTLGEHQFGKCC